MVRAILAGTKSQTRRLFKVPGVVRGTSFTITSPDEEVLRFDDGTFHYASTAALSGPYHCPYGIPGDRLWVRETWFRMPHPAECGITKESIPGTWDLAVAAAGRLSYRADPGSEMEIDGMRWRSPIHMPRQASRILLEVTDVRVERLQDISEADAIAEGVQRHLDGWFPYGIETCLTTLVAGKEAPAQFCRDARASYRMLWEQINGAGSWDANPWVWAITFRAAA